MKCTFCGSELERGTGKMFVYTDGRVAYYCSHKCEKNELKLKKRARDTRWTDAYRREKQMALSEKAGKKSEKETKQ
ncbi:TPA: 50S ribosomal protein L24e [Candidatus Woesearchaeota archaeon]|nr:MAG: large subunit ribosomal protein L24e [archaeon GW2011_AR16]HIG96121.1 50S ribosomal protein L24e [Candidatus Woesearchaeota archaeon]HIH47370.1 50S ribosomal protein L24e [Candidatus Woesearchaeota archaeon]HII89241.1 50S ribosomal protein L24e [Candidatus Woesearchaeota archaeon]